MKLFANHKLMLGRIQRVADTMADELPDCRERDLALSALADAGAYALRASALRATSREVAAKAAPHPAVEVPTGAEAELARAEMFSSEGENRLP